MNTDKFLQELSRDHRYAVETEVEDFGILTYYIVDNCDFLRCHSHNGKLVCDLSEIYGCDFLRGWVVLETCYQVDALFEIINMQAANFDSLEELDNANFQI